MDNEQCRTLIEHYKSNKVLWDSGHKQYHNKNLREDAWRDIAQQMKLPVADLKKKMTALMGSYRRERSRYKQSLVTGSGRGEVYISKWFAIDCFDFLSEKNQPNKTSDTMDDNIESNNEAVVIQTETVFQTSEASPQTSVSTQPKVISSVSTPKPRKRQRTSDAEDPVLQEAVTLLRKSTESATTDPYLSFGQHIANELRKYDPQMLIYVKHAINNIIFEADIGRFQTQPNYRHAMQYGSIFRQHSSNAGPSSTVTTPFPSPSLQTMPFSPSDRESEISEIEGQSRSSADYILTELMGTINE